MVSKSARNNATVSGGIHACRLEIDAPDVIFTKTSSKEFSCHILERGEWIGTNGILILVAQDQSSSAFEAASRFGYQGKN